MRAAANGMYIRAGGEGAGRGVLQNNHSTDIESTASSSACLYAHSP